MKNKGKHLLIIGHFGGDKVCLDGQTIKTKMLEEELLKRTDYQIHRVDTYLNNTNKLKLLALSVINLIKYRDVIVLLSGGGMRVYYLMLYFFAKLRGTRVYQSTLGGNLDQYVDKYPKYKKYLNSFKINWLETGTVQKRLVERGVTNAVVLENFKKLNILKPEELNLKFTTPLKLCTFSRVMREKGIETAVNVIDKINKEAGKTVFTLDIYGQVWDENKEWFESLQKKLPEAVKYMGKVDSDKSVEVLKDYFMLLFPTHFTYEGVPGTLIDAYSAGVPVLASKWISFADLVDEGVTGLGYEFDDIEDFERKLIWVLQNPEKITAMKQNCLEKAKLYLPDRVMEIILKKLEEN